MTVADELAQVRARERELLHTACGECGHELFEHNDRCYYPRFPRKGGPPVPKCRCVRFVDPEERLV